MTIENNVNCTGFGHKIKAKGHATITALLHSYEDITFELIRHKLGNLTSQL